MAEQFSMEWARGIVEGGVQKAQGIMDDPAQLEGLLQELQNKLEGLPASVANAFGNVPVMVDMVKSYITREYTEVSPKVIISLVSAFLYLVKKDDLIPDSIPVVGFADDLAVATIAMVINEPELKAFTAWRESTGTLKAAAPEPMAAPEVENALFAAEAAVPEYAERENTEQE
jgi:uncharacterized membrane protein YkvA (DUF1232 family)